MSTSDAVQTRTGERVELARYTISSGERVIYGQRINGVVRFLPDEPVVIDDPSGGSEDGNRRPAAFVDGRERPDGGCADRLNRGCNPLGPAGTTGQRGQTGKRVELGRYSTSAGERILYGQRVLGVVRVTDVPLIRGGRSLSVHGSRRNPDGVVVVVSSWLALRVVVGGRGRLGWCARGHSALSRSATLGCPGSAT